MIAGSRRTGQRRTGQAAVLAAAALLLAGCGADKPTVTFDVGGNALVAAPTQFCDTKMQNCADEPNARVAAPVPPGTEVKISVPDEVSSAPWQIVYAFTRPGQKAAVQQRVPLTELSGRNEYTLRLPEPGDTLVTAQVQLYGPAPSIDPQSRQIQFPIRATWVLVGEGAPA
ncbi:DUF2771 family protein [Pseudonocardia phyllosphaerae]|uniref:DUF2771 family protein n=1 Tax=Pseudonocardia phyllosphaerae TaxID=3390502 RepID=UPI00397E65AC